MRSIFIFLCLSSSPLMALRVASFNLENYLSQSRIIDGVYRQDYPKPELEKSFIRRSILSVSADIIVFQELGGMRYLRELQRDLLRFGLDYSYSYLVEASDPLRHIAVLSRVAFASCCSVDDIQFNYFKESVFLKRGLLEISIEQNGELLYIYGFHLKSAYGAGVKDPFYQMHREKASRAIRNYICRKGEGRFILLGDLNDTKMSGAYKRFTSLNKSVLSKSIDCRDSRGETWTYYYSRDESYVKLDYIFVSPILLQNVVSSGIDDPGLLFQGSDHRMLYIDLEL